jgi:hypothetical protein
METRHMKQGLIAALWGLAGCASSDQILLGREQLQHSDGGTCSPGQCADAGSDAGDPGAMPQAPIPPSAPCDGPIAGQLPFALHVTSAREHLCPGHSCQLDLRKLRPAADGSVWLAADYFGASGPSSSMRTWLAHYAADGTLLGETTRSGGYDPQLALDDHGQAWLLSRAPEGLTLQRFDATVQPLGAPIAAPDARGLVAQAGQGVLLLTGSGVSSYDYEGEFAWSQPTGDPGGAYGLAATPTGFAVLSGVARTQMYSGIDISAHAADGTPLWSGASSVNVAGAPVYRGTLNDWTYFYDVDANDNLVLGVVPPSTIPGGPNNQLTGVLDLESFDATGQSRWSLRVASAFNLGLALAPSGEIWVADFEGARPIVRPSIPGQPLSAYDPSGTIAVISQDGSACRRYAYNGIEMVNALEFAATGELWFMDHDAFGRFELPTP